MMKQSIILAVAFHHYHLINIYLLRICVFIYALSVDFFFLETFVAHDDRHERSVDFFFHHYSSSPDDEYFFHTQFAYQQ